MNALFTTKNAKDTKGSDIFDYKLRALRVLRGEICFSFFGCGFAALGLCGEYSLTPNPENLKLSDCPRPQVLGEKIADERDGADHVDPDLRGPIRVLVPR